jgi:RNA polymerase sigma-70 factor (ECF subfamily)
VTTSEVRDEARLTTGSDQDFLERLRNGDESAFAQLVDDLSPLFLHVARRYVSDRHAAEDVVQETWLGVVRGLPNFEGRSTLRSWAFSIMLNQARSRRARDQRVVASSVLTDGDESGPTVDPARFQGPDGQYPDNWTSAGRPQPWTQPERCLLDREINEVVSRALDGLPERQRLVVQLRDLHGLSSEETCAAMDISAQNQRVLLHRGRAAIRATLESYYRG